VSPRAERSRAGCVSSLPERVATEAAANGLRGHQTVTPGMPPIRSPGADRQPPSGPGRRRPPIPIGGPAERAGAGAPARLRPGHRIRPRGAGVGRPPGRRGGRRRRPFGVGRPANSNLLRPVCCRPSGRILLVVGGQQAEWPTPADRGPRPQAAPGRDDPDHRPRRPPLSFFFFFLAGRAVRHHHHRHHHRGASWVRAS